MERPVESVRPYNLVVAIGRTPQILTETIWALAGERPTWFPASIHVLTTSDGEAYLQAQLHGVKGLRDRHNRPIPNTKDRWRPFVKKVLRKSPVQPQFEVPVRDHGVKVDDIRHGDDDKRFANRCYRLVYDLTRPGKPPLIASIAGGRKTMSAHLMTSLSVHGRAEDRLVHVLVDERAEQDRDFFYWTPQKPYDIDLVNVPFPRLYVVLKDLMDELPYDDKPFHHLLQTLDPYDVQDQVPARLEVHMGEGDVAARLVFLNRFNEVIDDQCTLSAGKLATFLVLAEYTKGGQQQTTRQRLLQDDVHDQRQWVNEAYRIKGPERLKRWTYSREVGDRPKDGVSRSMSQLNKHIAQTRFAQTHLEVDSVDISASNTEAARAYYWRRSLPGLRLIRHNKKLKPRWPFKHLPEPDYLP